MRYYTENELKEIHSLLLGLLKAFKKICDEESVWYTLSYGTLLGAVRHQGFIPWDADADVCLKISDVDKFRDAFYKYKPKGICLIDRSRISHNMQSHDSLCYENNVGYPGIHLDIYPLIGAPNDEKRQLRVWKRNYFLDKLFRTKYVKISDCLKENRLKVSIVKMFDKLLPDSFIKNNIRKRENEFDVNTSDYWTCLASPYKPVNKHVWDKLILMKFEDDEYSVPQNYDLYLKTIYGDYMKPRKY